MDHGVRRSPLIPLIPLLLLSSCSSGPEPPRPGSPEFLWQAAKKTYDAGDYAKTADNLDRLAATKNDYTARARAWKLVLAAGTTKGLMDMGDNFEAGMYANKARMGPLRTQMDQYRARADKQVLQFAETYLAFKKDQTGPSIELAFDYPKGSALPAPELTNIAKGQLPGEAEKASAERHTIRRGIVMVASQVVGAPGDTAKAKEQYRTVPVQIPRETYMYAMANLLRDFSKLYERRKLSIPDRQKFFMEQALDALKGATESKDSKKLTDDLQSDLKKIAQR